MAEDRAGRRRQGRQGLVARVGQSVTGAAQSVTGAAREVTSATAEQVLEGLEPVLVEDSLPRILDGLTPYLTETLIPQVLADLRPYISEQLVPEVLDSVTPQIEAEVAPRILDALLPRIEAEVAPRLVDALLPKIRAEVVPTILEDIVDDPSVRNLIREQSAGLLLDALESVRENLADVDDLAEGILRRLTGQPVRERPEQSLELLLAESDPAQPVQLTWDSLERRRRAWAEQPVPPAPPGREHAYAGAVTRLLGVVIDLTVVGWLVGLGVATVLNLLDSVFPGLPTWVPKAISLLAAGIVPVYLGLAWRLFGRTLGSFLMGTRVCTADGRRPGFWRAQVRGWAGFLALPVWVITGVLGVYDRKRRTPLDRILHTEVRYVVPEEQQRRYLREVVRTERQAALAQQVAQLPASES
jgi:uncharacterized RDD family membrane protein YckC